MLRSIHLNEDEALFEEEITEDLSVNLPPLPVKTRWNSWFKFVIWMKNYYHHFVTFFIQEHEIQSSNAIKELKEIFESQNQCFYVEILFHLMHKGKY